MGLDDEQPKIRRSRATSVVGGILVVVGGILGFEAYRTQTSTPSIPTAYHYTINQNVATAVSYFDSSFYTHGPTSDNNAYVSELTKDVTVHFDYGFHGDTAAELTRTYDVKADVQATYAIKGNSEESSSVWTKSFQLIAPTTEKKSATDISDSRDVVIPYADYKKIASDFRTALSLPTTSQVILTYTVHISGSPNGVRFDDVRSSRVTLALEDQIFQPSVKFDKSDAKQVAPEAAKNNQETSALIKGIFGALAAIAGCALVAYGQRKRLFKTPYQRELRKIYRYHEGIIVRTSRRIDISNKEIIPVRSFDDLINIEEELKLPIVATELNSESTAFLVIHDTVVYRYVLGREPLAPSVVQEAIASLENTPDIIPKKPLGTHTTTTRMSQPIATRPPTPITKPVPAPPKKPLLKKPVPHPRPAVKPAATKIIPTESKPKLSQPVAPPKTVTQDISVIIETPPIETVDIRELNSQLEKTLHSSTSDIKKPTPVSLPDSETPQITTTHKTPPTFDDVVRDFSAHVSDKK